jgi:DNA-directed RNA polymerase subunit M/transcription elongation factor TFIIS
MNAKQKINKGMIDKVNIMTKIKSKINTNTNTNTKIKSKTNAIAGAGKKKINPGIKTINIADFDQTNEYIKFFTFRTSASNNIRPDVMHYAIKHLDRTNTLFSLARYVSVPVADKIEKGTIEFTMIHISNENGDVLEFIVNIYQNKIRDICANLDMKNKRINNQTLTQSLVDGSMDPYWIAFMTPQQIHPIRWAKELEKRRVAEAASNDKKVTDIYKCRKCGDSKSTTTQMQTRSADEPMTIFVTCVTCYNTFTTQ